jgi:hypothetical protein
MPRAKYGVTYDDDGSTVFQWFLGDTEVYDPLFAALGLEKPAAGTYDKSEKFPSHSYMRQRIAVRVNDAGGLPAGRRLLWCATDELEEVIDEGALSGLAYGAGGDVITDAYVPRNLAYS